MGYRSAGRGRVSRENPRSARVSRVEQTNGSICQEPVSKSRQLWRQAISIMRGGGGGAGGAGDGGGRLAGERGPGLWGRGRPLPSLPSRPPCSILFFPFRPTRSRVCGCGRASSWLVFGVFCASWRRYIQVEAGERVRRRSFYCCVGAQRRIVSAAASPVRRMGVSTDRSGGPRLQQQDRHILQSSRCPPTLLSCLQEGSRRFRRLTPVQQTRPILLNRPAHFTQRGPGFDSCEKYPKNNIKR